MLVILLTWPFDLPLAMLLIYFDCRFHLTSISPSVLHACMSWSISCWLSCILNVFCVTASHLSQCHFRQSYIAFGSRFVTGLSFSEVESSALIQTSGGPCAVITPLQAYVIKNILFTTETTSSSVKTEENYAGTSNNHDLNSLSGELASVFHQQLYKIRIHCCRCL